MPEPQPHLPFRQIHLDFHNSALIPDIASNFDPEAFAQSMVDAHVQSVTVFSKCHHGLSYHPTDLGRSHPNLARDLLGEQVGALHARGIRAVAYLSVVFDEHAGEAHPEWRQMDRGGRFVGRRPTDDAGWIFLCMGGPYLDYLTRQADEVMSRYPVDGVFYDIVGQNDPACYCADCLRRYAREGVHLLDDQALRASSLRMVRAGMDQLSTAVWHHRPDATIFFNSRLRLDAAPDRGVGPEMRYQSHIEIESLPTGGWGYQHFPTFARYFQTYNCELTGMTARFHGAWSDFGTLKSAAALDYELSLMLAMGARCGVGDQLHPRGVPDAATYELIGSAFAKVAAKEAWCVDAVPVADVALLLVADPGTEDHSVPGWTIVGAAQRALREEGFLFQVVDRDADWSRYAALVLPDVARLDYELSARVAAYVAGGGRVLATYQSGLTADASGFALPGFPVELVGEIPTEHDLPFIEVEYLDLEAELDEGLPDEDFVVFGRGLHVSAPPTTVRGRIGIPYFQRSWSAFSGHRQAPLDRWTDLPAAVRTDGVLYLAHNLFTQYGRHANLAHRRVIGNALRSLLDGQRVRTSLPAGGTVTLTRQPGRWVLHLLHGIPERRGDIEVIEDAIRLHDVRVEVGLPFAPRAASLVPQNIALDLTYAGGVATVTVPAMQGHQMISFEEPPTPG